MENITESQEKAFKLMLFTEPYTIPPTFLTRE